MAIIRKSTEKQRSGAPAEVARIEECIMRNGNLRSYNKKAGGHTVPQEPSIFDECQGEMAIVRKSAENVACWTPCQSGKN